ncbi:unnamed protein product [Adineta ricciae]|uniref:Neuroendocrine protein 7B2 n=1 Tax=Adineta ricciae TaxID=249248 RepID=A0A815YC18_ADIRI|nr:unnamed protein product [Adineta ricciae]
MQYKLSKITAILILFVIQRIQAVDWIDYDQAPSNIDLLYGDDADQYLSALTRDDEQEIHSPIITGYKYVSGGAGEGRQHLSPNGEIPNHPEVKTDDELPSFCHPPNPCPLGFEDEDCDASPMAAFTAEYSRLYQSKQNCRCDKDHDACSNKNGFDQPSTKASNDNLKRSRRVGRVCPF